MIKEQFIAALSRHIPEQCDIRTDIKKGQTREVKHFDCKLAYQCGSDVDPSAFTTVRSVMVSPKLYECTAHLRQTDRLGETIDLMIDNVFGQVWNDFTNELTERSYSASTRLIRNTTGWMSSHVIKGYEVCFDPKDVSVAIDIDALTFTCDGTKAVLEVPMRIYAAFPENIIVRLAANNTPLRKIYRDHSFCYRIYCGDKSCNCIRCQRTNNTSTK